MTLDLQKLRQDVIAAVKEAAAIVDETFTVTQKDTPANLVTSADIRVQAFLEERLCRLLPGSAFFAEEETAASAVGEYLWVVDPIDGTTNFARSIPQFAISVALLHNERPVMGVVYNPRSDTVYHAVAGDGAMRDGTPIHVSDVPFSRGLFCTAMSLYNKDYAPLCMEVIMEVYGQCADVRRFGAAALELCYLAEGICDLYFEIRVFPWDYAAALLILQEAGGVITGLAGEPLGFDRATVAVAANTRENHERLLAVVRKHIKELPYNEVFR